jgi:hypothetical protein
MKSYLKRSSFAYTLYEIYLILTRFKDYVKIINDYFLTKNEFKNSIYENNNNTDKKCLIVSFGTIHSTKLESILASGFLRNKWHVTALINSPNPWIKRYFKVCGIRDTLHINNFKPSKNEMKSISYDKKNFLKKDLSFKKIKNLFYKDIRIGPTILSKLMRSSQKASDLLNENNFSSRFESALMDTMQIIYNAQKILKTINPKIIYLIEANDFNKPLVEMAIKKNIKVIQINQPFRDDALIFKALNKQTLGYHPTSITKTSLDHLVKNKWLKKHQRVLDEDFENRYNGKWVLQSRNQPKISHFDKNALIHKLGLDHKKKIAVVFSHVLWDANLFYGDDIYEDYSEWFYETVKSACINRDINWLIKLHPGNIWKRELENKTNELAEISLLKSKNLWPLPSHVKILFPETNVSTLSLYKIIDYGITVRGTAGMELPVFGVPCITAGTGRYSNLGFTINHSSKKTYEDMLLNISNVKKITQLQIKKAKWHAYAIFCLRPWIYNSFKVTFEEFKNFNPFAMNLKLNIGGPKHLHEQSDIQEWIKWAMDEKSNPDFMRKL